MAELIDKNHILPHRMFAMIDAVRIQSAIPRNDLIRLLQPEKINESIEVSSNIYRKCQICGLLQETGDKDRTTTLAVDPKIASDFEAFRRYMQQTVFGVTRDEADFFIMNLFAAWFAVQDEWAIASTKSDWEIKFNGDMFPGVAERFLSEHPGITAWMEWADFLGWGWQLKFGAQEANFMPDATRRISAILPELLPDHILTGFPEFMARLPNYCPELDGGLLFKRCLEASRPGEQRGNRLSLMLSTALRVLHQQGAIVLEDRADAVENWSLFPSQSFINRVTHIQRGHAS